MLLCTAAGEEHGLLKKLSNSVKLEDACKNMTPEQKAEMEKRRKEDARVVRAQYVHRKEDNGKLDKPYVRHAGDPIQIWRFLNGYEYDVPKGLIDEVNESSLPKRDNQEHDKKPVKDQRPERVHQFIPVKW